MDCLQVQQLLSEAFDREPVDPARLAEAERHAAACPACGAFGAGLPAIGRGGPRAPEGLAEGILGRIARETGATPAAVAPAEDPVLPPATAPSAAAVPVADAARPPLAPVPAAGPVPARPRRKALAWQLSAAAAIVVGFALLTTYGISLMSQPMGERTATSAGGSDLQAAPDEDARHRHPVDVPLGESGLPGVDAPGYPDDQAASLDGAPPMVSLSGKVYRFERTVEATAAPGAPLGSVTTSGDGGPVGSVKAYPDPGKPGSLLIASGDDWSRFTMVTRTVGGRAYVLTVSGGLERYGDWPRLPGTYPEPASADGSPIFDEWGEDDTGVAVYAPRGEGIEKGFAIAPGTPAADPAAGNPYWTWWAPL